MIIFDLDGTLADCKHRRHFVDPKLNGVRWGAIEQSYSGNYVDERGLPSKWKPNWTAFFEACDGDSPIEPVINVFDTLNCKRDDVEIWSGRCESVRDKTEKWLLEYSNSFERDQLVMRPIGDYTPDDELKESWLYELLENGDYVHYVFDDRPKVIRMWRRSGVFVYNCNQTGEEF